MAGALEGVRVIDFGQYIAGPQTAMMLGDQGAEVIRVDPPGGPRWKSPANATYNRGKRSIVLDLKNDADRTIAQKLIASADIVVENFRPGVMNRLGVGAECMMAKNTRLIYCSLPGFASDDPRKGVAAWEGVVAAAANTYRPPRDSNSDRPVYTAIPLASSFASFIAATSIVLALYAREREGVGRRIEVPLFDAMFTAFGAHGMSGDNAGSPARSADIWGGGRYQCGDGRWVQYATANPRFVEALVEIGNVPEWRDEGFLDRQKLVANPEMLVELRKRITALFKTRPACEWEESLAPAGAPITLIRSPEEWMKSEHASAIGAVVEVKDYEYGSMLQTGFPIHMSDTKPEIKSGRSPLGSDRESILSELEERVSIPQEGSNVALNSILDGVRVLDLTQVLAGPTGGRTLAEFGADVIKINNPANPPIGYRYHIDVNRGKRTMLLDLQTKEGIDVFWKLVDQSDIVMQNFTQGVAERLGIGYEQVKARKPDVVYSSVSAFGYNGPWGDRRGYEPLGQGMSGMQFRAGGDGPPAMQPFAVTDYGTGILSAFSMSLGLYHRSRTGKGQHVEAALAYTGTMFQSPFFQHYEGKVWDEPKGQEALGSSPIHRLYEAGDGWLFLGARESDLPKIAKVAGLSGIEGLKGNELEKALEERIAEASVTDWIERLAAIDVGVHGLPSIREIMSDPWVISHGLSITREHEGVGMVTSVGPPSRVSRTPTQPGRAVRPPGADNREILGEIGMSRMFDEFVSKKVIVEPVA